MKLINEEAIGYNDVTVMTDYSTLKSRSDVNLNVNGVEPIIPAPMYHLGTPEFLAWCANNNMITTLHRYFDSAEEQYKVYTLANVITDAYDIEDFCYFAVGKDREWIDKLMELGVTKFCVDMAHGNSAVCYETIEYIKMNKENVSVMAGNIETVDAYIRMCEFGVDYVRVGIAGGSICSTNKATAVGVPVLTAVRNIRQWIDNRESGLMEHHNDYKYPIIVADGGIDGASNALKAIGFGADMVMAGRFFAGTSLAKGPFYTSDMSVCLDNENLHEYPIKYAAYAGMASAAMRNTTSSQKMDSTISVEGVSGVTPYMGSTTDVYEAFKANMRSGVSYVGALNLNQYREDVIFQRISLGGQHEKQTHIIEV